MSAYFSEGRCSGHHQFNGRYCRDSAGPERWCIHCEGFMLQQQLSEAQRQTTALRAALAEIASLDDPFEEFTGNGEACRFCLRRKMHGHRPGCAWVASHGVLAASTETP